MAAERPKAKEIPSDLSFPHAMDEANEGIVSAQANNSTTISNINDRFHINLSCDSLFAQWYFNDDWYGQIKLKCAKYCNINKIMIKLLLLIGV